MEAIKIGSTRRINTRRGKRARLWQGRFFDPGAADGEGISQEDGIHSSEPSQGGVGDARRGLALVQRTLLHRKLGGGRLAADRVLLPAEERTRI